MPINPNIILGIQQPQFKLADPLESAGRALSLQNMMGQQDLQGLQMRQAQLAEADDMAVREAHKAGGGQQAIIDRLMGAGQYKPAQALQKSMLETEEKRGTINKNRAETMGKLLTFQKDGASAVMANPTAESAMAAVDQFERMAASFGMPELGQQAATQRAAIQAAGNNPDALRRIASGWALTADKFLPQLTQVNDGKTTRFVDQNTLSNPNAGTQAITMLTTPGQDQVDRRTREEGAANRGVTMRGQDMTDVRARDLNTITQQGNVAKNETDLRKEFDGLAEVKNYKMAMPAYTAIVDAAKRNTPQADINLVYGIAKLYDPTSVVREGEYATVANSPNIPERIKGYAQYIAGGGKLSPETKRQIVAEANSRIGSYEAEYGKAKSSFETIATERGLNPGLVIPAMGRAPRGGEAMPPPAKDPQIPGREQSGKIGGVPDVISQADAILRGGNGKR